MQIVYISTPFVTSVENLKCHVFSNVEINSLNSENIQSNKNLNCQVFPSADTKILNSENKQLKNNSNLLDLQNSYKLNTITMQKKSISISIDMLNNKTKEESLEFKILCLDLKNLPPFVQFLYCCFGVFFFYLIYGYFQELIFTVEGFKPYGWYLTMVQFAMYFGFSLIESRVKINYKRKIPLKIYFLLALLTVGTMGFSNSSLGYLNYPMQVIFKCCKLIPVLIGGILIQGKKYSSIDWLACFCMILGLICFTLADSSITPTFSLFGVFLINIALSFDAIIGNTQEKYIKQFNATNSEVILYSYGIGFCYIFIVQVLTSQINEAFKFCLKHPVVYVYIFLFSFSGYLGVNIVLSLVKVYGALIAVTVTTFRKGLTIFLSFIIFAKPFTIQYLWSGLIVLLGIYLNLYSKNRVEWNAKATNLIKRILPFLRKPRLVALKTLRDNVHVV